jgi:hypothetical protein
MRLDRESAGRTLEPAAGEGRHVHGRHPYVFLHPQKTRDGSVKPIVTKDSLALTKENCWMVKSNREVAHTYGHSPTEFQSHAPREPRHGCCLQSHGC